MTNKMEKIISLAKRRGFIFPGSEIYGGLANSWDYGPLGVELKNNIKNEWWRRFVRSRADVVGVDTALIMNTKVWEASGHLKEFSDPLVECKKCHTRFRENENGKSEILNSKSETNSKKIECPNCESTALTKPKQFNLMFKTLLGPAEEEANVVYLRPETAQGMFVNFKNVLDTTRRRLPFGIAQMGKAFRNEITPGNFIFRTREFEQMEIEYFVREKEWEKWFEHWLGEIKQWLKDLGIAEKNLHFNDIPKKELAHYSKRTVDIEYEYPFGREELYGLAYRTDFDLKNHMEKSGEDLRYTDLETGEKFVPHVIEPTWGVDRSILAAMLEAYHEERVSDKRQATPNTKTSLGTGQASDKEEGGEDTRVVMKFPKWLAPVKVAILPLSKKEELIKIAKPFYEELSKEFVCEYDETQSIGRRYRRQDEIGTPVCLTVDFDTLNDKAVTLRDRDTMKQVRVNIKDIKEALTKTLKT